MRAIVLAGGKGSRLAPYTKNIPKPLVPIGDMPILEILLRQLKLAGIKDVTLTVGHLAEILRSFLQDGSRLGMNISYSYEENPLGTSGPLSLIKGLDESFLVTNGDVLTDLRIDELIKFHKQQGAMATIAMHQRQVNIDLGVIQCDGNQKVIGYVEKPTIDYLVSMGIYVFEPGILAYIPHNQYLDFPDLVHLLLDAGEKVVGYLFNGYWQDLGRPDDYEYATNDFESMRSQFLPES